MRHQARADRNLSFPILSDRGCALAEAFGLHVLTEMIALNRQNSSAVDDRFLDLKPAPEEAVKDHSAL